MLRRVEEALERVIEGGLGRLSGVSVHPLEIARRLQARMQDAKLVSTGAPYVPNRYVVALHDEDLAALAGVIEDVAEQIAGHLEEHAAEQGWARGNHIEVAIGGGGQSRGRIEIEHAFDESPPDARLLVEVGEPSGGMFEIGERVTIGRDPSCEVALTDPSVSRRHASIEWTYAGYVLRDLGSRNGTFVGGEPVGETTLIDGDLVQVGSAALRLAMRE
jgi:hypothetical protein